MAKEKKYKLEPQVVRLLNSIKEFGDPKPLLYFDIKNGTNKIKDEQCREYWDCVINNALKSNRKDISFPGFGNHFLQKVIECGNKRKGTSH